MKYCFCSPGTASAITRNCFPILHIYHDFFLSSPPFKSALRIVNSISIDRLCSSLPIMEVSVLFLSFQLLCNPLSAHASLCLFISSCCFFTTQLGLLFHRVHAVGWIMPPINSDVDALPPNVMVFGQKVISTEPNHSWHPDLGLPAPRTVRKQIAVKPPIDTSAQVA